MTGGDRGNIGGAVIIALIGAAVSGAAAMLALVLIARAIL